MHDVKIDSVNVQLGAAVTINPVSDEAKREKLAVVAQKPKPKPKREVVTCKLCGTGTHYADETCCVPCEVKAIPAESKWPEIKRRIGWKFEHICAVSSHRLHQRLIIMGALSMFCVLCYGYSSLSAEAVKTDEARVMLAFTVSCMGLCLFAFVRSVKKG